MTCGALARACCLQAPRPRKRHAVVLDEDVYTDSIEAIIERDYFPDLPKLRNKLDWLEAVRSGARASRARARAVLYVRPSGAPRIFTVADCGDLCPCEAGHPALRSRTLAFLKSWIPNIDPVLASD